VAGTGRRAAKMTRRVNLSACRRMRENASAILAGLPAIHHRTVTVMCSAVTSPVRCSTKCLPPLPSSVRACPTADRGQLFSMRGNSPLRAYPPQRVRPDIHTISPLPIYDSCRIVVSHFAGMCVRNHLFGCLNEERVGYRLTDWPVCKLKSVTKSTPLQGPAATEIILCFRASDLAGICRNFHTHESLLQVLHPARCQDRDRTRTLHCFQ
jgi:hypothetical protein